MSVTIKLCNNNNNLSNTDDVENNDIYLSTNEDDDDYDNLSEEEDFSDYIVDSTKTLFSNNSKFFCLFKSSGIQYIEKWELNRKINNDRVNDLYKIVKENLETSSDINIHEPIHIAFNINDRTYKLVDGQHRYEAILKLHNENTYAIFEIPCFVHHIDSEEDMMDLLGEINNRVPLSKEEFNKYKIPLIIDSINKQWENPKLKWVPFGKNRPTINKDILEKNLKKNEVYFEKISLDTIMYRLNEINNHIRGLKRSKRVEGKRINKNINEKAETFNFFLGLDKDMKWIKYIFNIDLLKKNE